MFSRDDVMKLEQAVRVKPKREKDDDGRTLADRLSEIAVSLLHERLWQQEPSPSKTVKRLKAVQRTAKALLDKLPRGHVLSDRFFCALLTAQASVKCSTEELRNLAGGSDRLRGATNAVLDIAIWSKAAISRESDQKIARSRPLLVYQEKKVVKEFRSSKRHKGDVAMQALIGNLAGVWIDYWKRLPGASRSDTTHKTGGPYIRFVQTFLKCVEGHLTEADFLADPGLKKRCIHRPRQFATDFREQVSPGLPVEGANQVPRKLDLPICAARFY